MEEKKKVAVIGAGIVGATAAYFLSKEEQIEVTIFDEGTGQGTAASAGIISPWLSRRRNKKWYNMVRKGAAFYPEFLSEVTKGEEIPTSVYHKTGTLLFKNKPEYLDETLEIGLKRREEAPEIGELKILSPEEIREKIPLYTGDKSAVWASGGARVGGKELIDLLIKTVKKQGASIIKERATLQQKSNNQYIVSSSSYENTFDSVVLAAAAWLPSLLEPLKYEVDIRPQKGQLVELKLPNADTTTWPVIMPEGEKDIIPFDEGRIVIGATHEDEAGFDLSIDESLLHPMIQESIQEFSSYFSKSEVISYRSGTRAYTSDYAPFVGKLPRSSNVFTASGLGSTGLTAGPLVGKILYQLVVGEETELNLDDYPISHYVKYQEG